MDTSYVDGLARAAHVAEAIEAIDWILEGRVPTAKALDPLDKGDLTKISVRLANSIKGTTGPAEAEAIAQALRTLDVDWNALNPKAREAVILSAKKALSDNLPKRVLPRVKQKIDVGVRENYSRSKRLSVLKHKLDIPFTMSITDTRVAAHVSESSVNFVRDQYGRIAGKLGDRVRAIVADGAKRGATSREIVKEIRSKVGSPEQIGRSAHYWEVASLSFINRARNYAQLSGFNEAGFQRYTWESVLDEVTTETCRFMHGKTFPIDGAMQTFERAEAQTDNPEAIKEIQPWISQGRDDDGNRALFFRGTEGEKVFVATINSGAQGTKDRVGDYTARMTDAQLLGNGVSLPPIHGLCRSTLLPDFTTPPRTLPLPVLPPPAPRAPRGAPRASKPRAPVMAKKGEHFEHFLSDLDREIEAEALTMFDDIGALPALKKNPLGRLVFAKKVRANAQKWDDAIPSGAGGAWWPDFWIHGAPMEKAVMKIRSTPGAIDQFRLAPTGPIPHTVTSSLRSKVDKIKATIAHEYGHHLHLSGERNVVGSGAKGAIKPTVAQARRQKIVNDAWKKWRAAVANGTEKGITQYAAQDSAEFFAESFAYHAIAPEILKERSPTAFAMVEEIRRLAKLKPVNVSRIATIQKAMDGPLAKATEPDYSKLFKITRETEQLFMSGKLTVQKLDEQAEKARKVDQGFEEWNEAFARYRDALTMPERVELQAAGLR